MAENQGQNPDGDGDAEDNEICQREGLFRWMSRFAQSPDKEHDDVNQRNRQENECKKPVSDCHGFVFGVAHGEFCLATLQFQRDDVRNSAE